MTRVISSEYRNDASVLPYWRWECPEHEWHGPWEMYRDAVREAGWDHDVHFHGLDPDEDF